MGRGATTDERPAFNARLVSPSRVNSLASCGIAFRMKYLEGLPSEQSGSAALFGSVFHLALEKWATDRTQPLLPLMRSAWIDFCKEKNETVLAQFLGDYQAISADVIRAEHAAGVSFEKRMKKPTKAPRMTKEFKESQACKNLNRLLARWLDKLNADSYYRFSERDPLPKLYDESLVLAKRYEARWKHLPPVAHVEFGFEEPWRGFTLHGYIDTIEPLVHPQTGEMQGIGVVDYKTYAKEPAMYKDWRQVVMYDAAVRSLVARGALQLPWDIDSVPLLVGMDYVRWNDTWKDEDGKPFPPRRFFKVTEADHARLERELNVYFETVEAGNFMPAEKGRNPDFCDFPSNCCLRSCSAAGGSSELVEVVL